MSKFSILLLKGGFVLENRWGQKDLARAYYEIQCLHRLWKPLQGLMKGTIFPELYRRVDYRKEHADGKAIILSKDEGKEI